MKVLVANRGEIAVRILRACREFGLATVAVYSEADEAALHTRLADEAVCIGPAAAAGSYLSVGALLDAARRTYADAVHPGYGFLAENAAFAEACVANDLIFIGPSPAAIQMMGNKAAAREFARSAGVPTVPGSNGIVSRAETASIAEEIGYPLMLKASAGGGGRGIRIAKSSTDLQEILAEAAREAHGAFGDDSIYVEKLLVRARHVELQVLGDAHGNVVHLYERECSIQRRRQKLVEESLAPSIQPDTRQAMADAATRLAKEIGYTSAGTVEFLVDDDDNFFFIEMNTRIQVEHPVTEMVTGVDIVKEQLRVANGEPLSVAQDDVRAVGAAIEFRINAEDPARDFFPSPGTVTAFHLPGGHGVRVDTALYPGCAVPPFYDSLVAKLIVWGATREEALARGRRALDEMSIEGIATTIPFHLRLLDDPGFVSGRYDTEHLAGAVL